MVNGGGDDGEKEKGRGGGRAGKRGKQDCTYSLKPKGLEEANVIGARLPGDEHRPAATDDSVPRCSVVSDPSPRAAAAISVGLWFLCGESVLPG